MVFKLVRTDTADPCKIQLPPGTHLFGRDKFLDCTDKRVSRNHGHLEVTVDTVTLKALHQNPCFYSRKGIEETQILRINDAIELNNGDRFGLLPDSFWYELLHCTISPDIGNGATENVPYDADNRVENTPSTIADEGSQMDKTVTNDDEFEIPEDFGMNESIESAGLNESQSLLPENQTSPDEPPSIHDIPNQNPPDEPPSIHDIPTQIDPLPPSDSAQSYPPTDSLTQSYPVGNEATSPSKRALSDAEQSDVKRIKTEVDDQPGTSDADGQAGPSTTDKVKTEPPSPTKPPQPAQASASRERCYYGAQCYRRNPQHAAQFSHPKDSDWGAGPRVACPRGAACCKRDPRHWRDHDHPPGTAPPPPHAGHGRVPGQRNQSPNSDGSQAGSPRPPPKKRPRRPKRPSNSGSESEDPAKLIVTGKRARKPVRRPSYNGSESGNEDPFDTDGSDDWMPPSDYTSSQDHTQTQDM